MKPRTFTQRWNITALKRIKKAYENTTWFVFLCEVPEFKQLWETHRANIRDLATDFHESAVISGACAGTVLFYNGPHRSIRLDFLNHEIARLTALSKTRLG